MIHTHFGYMITVLYIYSFQRDNFPLSHAILYHVTNRGEEHDYLPRKKHLTAAQNISL
jgi:hypothetical protein